MIPLLFQSHSMFGSSDSHEVYLIPAIIYHLQKLKEKKPMVSYYPSLYTWASH